MYDLPERSRIPDALLTRIAIAVKNSQRLRRESAALRRGPGTGGLSDALCDGCGHIGLSSFEPASPHNSGTPPANAPTRPGHGTCVNPDSGRCDEC